jgi:hypothetical protein
MVSSIQTENVGSNGIARKPATLAEVLRVFHQSLQAYYKIGPS